MGPGVLRCGRRAAVEPLSSSVVRAETVPVSCRSRAFGHGAIGASYGRLVVDLPLLLAPSSGPVAAHFAYRREGPFRPGQRRTLGFAAAPRSRIVAACGGPVTFAGPVPGGRAVAVRCGRWSVVVGGLGRVAVRAGSAVAPGKPLGTAAAGGVSLSVRPAGDRFGYVDPEPLLRVVAAPRRFVPIGSAPRPSWRRRAPGRSRVPVPVRRLEPVLVRAPSGQPTAARRPAVVAGPPARRAPAPPLAWLGLALAALGLPAVRRGRRGARLGIGRGSAPTIGAFGAARPERGTR